MNLPAVILPEYYAERLARSGRNSGTLDVKWNAAEELALIDGLREGTTGTHRQGLSEVPRRHHLRWAATNAAMGLWFRVDPQLHLVGLHAARRRAATKLDAFRGYVVGGDWTVPGREGATLAVTVTPDLADHPREDDDELRLPFAAWRLHGGRGSAEMLPIMVAAEAAEPLLGLGDAWPLGELQHTTVALIGAGSIGSAAAEALGAYGVRHLVLIDPDRLHGHNFARHRAGEEHLGRYKVNAMAEILTRRDPQMRVEPLVLDVIYDADEVRPVLDEVDVVLVSSDGIDSRRAANHLARRAGKPAVFACVLADGGFGEVLRVRPPRTGCLLCARAQLVEEGGLDPEPALDRGYGTGTRHLPMTAVGGDLTLVGQLAAKAVVATVLEKLGFRDQRLPADHAIIGLRPKPNMAKPFDISRAGDLHWRELPPPREQCPTCGVPG